MKSLWDGVIPAITTPFNADYGVDVSFLTQHARWLVDEGAVGLVPIGNTPAEFAERMRADTQRYAKLIKQVGLVPN